MTPQVLRRTKNKVSHDRWFLGSDVYWKPPEYKGGVLSYFVGYVRMLPVSRLWKASVRIAGVKAEI
jgi:hypothetical protein